MALLSSVPPALADGVIAVIFLCFAIFKGERGLSRSLLPLAATVLALGGAAAAASLLQERVTEAVYPWVCRRLAGGVDLSSIRSTEAAAISDQLERLMPDQLLELIGRLGLEVRSFVTDAIQRSPRIVGENVAGEALEALLYPVTAAAVRCGLFVIGFLVLRLALGLVLSAAGLVFELPLLRGMDVFLGALLGVLECALLLAVLCRVLRPFVPEPLTEYVEGTRLLRLFFAQGSGGDV